MKRSDLIECKGLFCCVGEPMGISGRIEIKEHGPVQLGGQILFFSRTGPEALKDYFSPMGGAMVHDLQVVMEM